MTLYSGTLLLCATCRRHWIKFSQSRNCFVRLKAQPKRRKSSDGKFCFVAISFYFIFELRGIIKQFKSDSKIDNREALQSDFILRDLFFLFLRKQNCHAIENVLTKYFFSLWLWKGRGIKICLWISFGLEGIFSMLWKGIENSFEIWVEV